MVPNEVSSRGLMNHFAHLIMKTYKVMKTVSGQSLVRNLNMKQLKSTVWFESLTIFQLKNIHNIHTDSHIKLTFQQYDICSIGCRDISNDTVKKTNCFQLFFPQNT